MSRKMNTRILVAVTLVLMILAIISTVFFLKDKVKESKDENFSLGVVEGPKVAEIQGTTITRFIEGEPKKVKEERVLGWNLIDFNIEEISTKITGNSNFKRSTRYKSKQDTR